MRSKLKFFASAALLTFTGPMAIMPAAAQDVAEESPSAIPGNILAEQRKFFDMFAKIFEVKDQAPIDPARLALAEKAIVKILPQGGLVKIMDGMVDRFLGPLSELTPDMATYEISAATGIYGETIDTLDEEKRKAITLLLDPARKQRLQQGFDVIRPLLNETMAELETPMRAGMSRAYARKFNAEQLTELNRFFATPTGAFYASEFYPLQNDPEVWQAMFSAMPKLVESITASAPALEKKAKALPKAKNVADLDEAELSRLAGLMGTSVQAVKEGRDSLSRDLAASAEAAAETAALDDPNANETGDEPWYDENNWPAAERENVNQLSAVYQSAADKSSETYADWEKAFNAALDASRAKYKAQGWKAESVPSGDSLPQ